MQYPLITILAWCLFSDHFSQVSIRSEKDYMFIRFSDVRVIVGDLIVAFGTQVATHEGRLWRPGCCLRAHKLPTWWMPSGTQGARFETSHHQVSVRSPKANIFIRFSDASSPNRLIVDGESLHIYVNSHSPLTHLSPKPTFAYHSQIQRSPNKLVVHGELNIYPSLTPGST